MGCVSSTGKKQLTQPEEVPTTQAVPNEVKRPTATDVVSDDAPTDIPSDTASAEAGTDETSSVVAEVFKAVLKGFVDESLPAVELAIKVSGSALASFKAAVASLKQGTGDSVAQGLCEMASALEALADAMTQAGATEQQVQDLVKVIAMFKDSKQIIFHIGQDLKVNGQNILKQIESAIKNFNEKAWSSFGEDLGLIIGEVLSPQAAPTRNPAETTTGFWSFFTCC
jgi:hypothetical protein